MLILMECSHPQLLQLNVHSQGLIPQNSTKKDNFKEKGMNLMKLDEIEMKSNEFYTYSAKPHFSAGRATLI